MGRVPTRLPERVAFNLGPGSAGRRAWEWGNEEGEQAGGWTRRCRG
ncbi:hypothetical protein MINT15_09980 [Saccharomonospora viridis]|uniref:Uncharacterized protein n=1 Tax=Saccharomonospora viridis TaxID=1852 RepID=A0A837DE67_9PSEU|nr:hypothetical protein MINT15_09980 [Saccharomonospora viridis]